MSYSVLSCVSLRFYPLSSGIASWHRVFGFPLFPVSRQLFPLLTPSLLTVPFRSFPLRLLAFTPSAPFPSLLLAPASFSSFSLPSLSHYRLSFCLFSLLLSLAPPLSRSSSLSLLLSLAPLFLAPFFPSPAPPLLEPDRRTAGIYFAAAFLVVAFLAAGFFAVFASSFTAVLAGDFRAAGSFSTFASALTALLRVVFFFGSGVPALRA